MSKVYITGHRNPDLDSLCAAVSYAHLKNMTDTENEYVPVHCSPVSDSVRKQMDEIRKERAGGKPKPKQKEMQKTNKHRAPKKKRRRSGREAK